MVRDTREIGNNLNKLWRQEDGRYLARGHVVKAEEAQFIPTVYLARELDQNTKRRGPACTPYARSAPDPRLL